MNIFVKIKNSIYNPEYYGEVAKSPFSYSLKYYLVFALIFALVFTTVITIKFIPTANILTQEFSKIPSRFPDGLVINIKDGKVSTNVPEPYFVKISEGFKSNPNVQPNLADLKNAIVIDTKDKFDIDTFNSYKTYSLLTADSVVYLNNKNQITIQSLSGVKNFTLNKEFVASCVNRAKPFIAFIYPIVFLGAFVGGYLLVLGSLIYLLLGALIIWLITKIKGIKLGYKKSYQLGMHLMAFAIITTGIIDLLPAKFIIPYLFTILFVLVTILNLKKETIDNISEIE